jgi:hypothetical protein
VTREPESPDDPTPTELTYQEVTDPAFAGAAAAFHVLPVPGGVVFRGPCPRCGDAMEFPHVTQTYRLGRRRRGSGRLSGTVPMICTCRSAHPGRPDGEDGCGAYWNVTVADTDR